MKVATAWGKCSQFLGAMLAVFGQRLEILSIHVYHLDPFGVFLIPWALPAFFKRMPVEVDCFGRWESLNKEAGKRLTVEAPDGEYTRSNRCRFLVGRKVRQDLTLTLTSCCCLLPGTLGGFIPRWNYDLYICNLLAATRGDISRIFSKQLAAWGVRCWKILQGRIGVVQTFSRRSLRDLWLFLPSKTSRKGRWIC